MPARTPRVEAPPPTAWRQRALQAVYWCACAWMLWSCGTHLSVESEDADAGPCGRGKARSCECEDGRRGIAQCLVGGDWGACWCEQGEPPVVDAQPPTQLGPDARTPLGPRTPEVALQCDHGFDLRAHAAGSDEPYLNHGAPALGAGSAVSMCFYFAAPYGAKTEALSFAALPDEVSSPEQWLLYGTHRATRAHGDVFPCDSIEPEAYLLASFSPGDDALTMPDDVALALPSGPNAGLILQVRYLDPGPFALLDRTGVRICAAEAGTRRHTAAVHYLGSEAICIPPATTDYEVSGVCTPRTDQGDIHILSVWPRMHARGRRMKVSVERADGSSETLHDAPFHPGRPVSTPTLDVVVHPGDRIETRCFYDNAGFLPVPYGDSSFDELCYAYVSAWPPGALSVDPSSLDPVRSWTASIQPSRRCLDPLGILRSCNGLGDLPR